MAPTNPDITKAFKISLPKYRDITWSKVQVNFAKISKLSNKIPKRRRSFRNFPSANSPKRQTNRRVMTKQGREREARRKICPCVFSAREEKAIWDMFLSQSASSLTLGRRLKIVLLGRGNLESLLTVLVITRLKIGLEA
ncbi:hypothetical protein Ddc_12373 [Ditylenchus destructor]|nr:hypothetical protein Ddc_12373 [Ditylenchus destructor]